MSPKAAMAAILSSASSSSSASITAATTTKINNQVNTRESVKTANLLTAKSTTAAMAKLPSLSWPILPSSLPLGVPKTAAPPPSPSPTPTSAFETISLALTPTKIDPYSMLSFASAASTTSVSMARMTTTTMKDGIMSYHNVIAMLTLLFLFSGLAGVDGLKCYMCGQYNEGVGSITPCLNYSESIRHLYLKDCSKPSEKYCVKYVSELSAVRDCAKECSEKEVWETQTYCCNTDGCNGAGNLQISVIMILMPLLYFIYRASKIMLKAQH